MPSPAQRLQTPDMEAHEGVRVFALPLETVADEVEMAAGSVNAAIALGDDGDVAIRRPRLGDDRLRLDDHASANVVEALRLGELNVMDASVDAIDDQIDLLPHLVAGQSLAEDAADDRRAGAIAVKEILVRPALLGEAVIGERPVHRLDDVVSLAERLQGRLGFVGDDPASGLRLGGEAIALQPFRPADQKMPILADRDRSCPRPAADRRRPGPAARRAASCRAGSAARRRLRSRASGRRRSRSDAPAPG